MFKRASRIGVLGLALAVTLSGGMETQAIVVPLLSANNSGAIPAYTGSQLFNIDFFTFTVNANVDFAVFAPGTFDTAYPGEDTSGGTEYVYAYQVLSLDPDTAVKGITVGLDGDEPLGVIGYIGDGVWGDPTSSAYVGSGPSSSAWDFTGASAIPNGSYSAILVFTSAAGPEWDTGTITSTEWSDEQILPSPVPEPASLALMGLGLGLAIIRKNDRA